MPPSLGLWLLVIVSNTTLGQESIAACVVDESYRPLVHARVIDSMGRTLGTSDEQGRVRIADVGAVRRIERLGFLPVEFPNPNGTSARSCVVMRPVRQALPAVVVTDARAPALGQSITRVTSQRAPALAEPDVFRSLPLASGVTQSNDLRATVHLAGGATDETGVLLDGHPLQWPFHAASALSAFNVAALERADVTIHHLRPDQGDVLAGLIELVPRVTDSRPSVAADVSLLSTTLTATLPGPWQVGALLSGRVTYLGAVIDRIVPSQDNAVPTYRDLLVRVSRGDSVGWSGSVLGYGTNDERRPKVSGPQGSRWGETMAGAQGSYASQRWRFHARLSADRTTLRDRHDQPALPRIEPSGQLVPSPGQQHVFLTQDWMSAMVSAMWRGSAAWQATVGQAIDIRRNDWDWNASAVRTILSPRAPFIVSSKRSQHRHSVFGNASYAVRPGHVIAAGLRATRLSGRTYLSPRLVLESALTEHTDAAAVIERRFQYDAIPEELKAGGLLPAVALLSIPRRADVVSLSGSHRFAQNAGRRTALRFAGFYRRYHDRPALSDVIAQADDAWPYTTFVRGTGDAAGLAITGESVVAGGLAIQGTYTLQRVVETTGGVTHPTSWDAPHTANVFASVPLRGRWTGMVLGQFHSGTATTPAEARVFVPSLTTSPLYSGRLIYGAPNSARLPAYQRVDVGIQREWAGVGVDWAFTAQAINVLNRRNLLTYDLESYFSCDRDRGACRDPRGERSLPFVPSLGIRGRWGRQ